MVLDGVEAETHRHHRDMGSTFGTPGIDASHQLADTAALRNST